MSDTVMRYQDRPVPPARREAAAAREIVDRCAVELARLPFHVDRVPILGAVARAFDDLTALEQSELDAPDHLDKLSRAKDALDALSGALAGIEHDAARGLVAAVAAGSRGLAEVRAPTLERVVARQHLAVHPAPQADTRASPPRASLAGEPAVHALAEPLSPASLLRVNPELPGREAWIQDPSIGELFVARLPQPRPRVALEEPGSSGELAQLRALARDLLEDIGALGQLRVLRAGEPFSSGIVRFEERLLRALDALAALGRPVLSADGATLALDVFAEVVAYAADGPAPDPARAFARAFVLSCLEGDAGVHAALLALRQSHPSLHPAQRDGLLLGSSPAIGPALRSLVADPANDLTALALDVLHARGEVDLGTLWPLLEHPDADMRRRAVRCLSVAPEREMASLTLEEMLDDRDERVVVAAVEGLCCLGAPAGLAAARRLLAADTAVAGTHDPFVRLDLLDLLGLVGDPADVSLLAASLVRRPREAEALGWHGHAGLLEPLIAALVRNAGAAGKGLFCAGIARALCRITGACPAQPADPGWWCAFWEEHAARFKAAQRFRFGRPHSLPAILDELCAEGTLGRDRERCALEVRIMTGGRVRLEVRGFTQRLLREVEALKRA